MAYFYIFTPTAIDIGAFGGERYLMAFGVYPEISLADARERRDITRKQVALMLTGITSGALSDMKGWVNT